MTDIARPRILIIDLRSQLTNNIERTIREEGYRSAILPPDKARKWLRSNLVDAIILSGGDFSVYQKEAPQPPDEIFSTRRQDGSKVPILGICYGMQWLARKLGGDVKAVYAEHGGTVIERETSKSVLFGNTPDDQFVWMNHSDSVLRVPEGFIVSALSKESGAIAAMENPGENLFAVQFHPEATHTDFGRHILRNFLEFAGCKKDWSPSSMVDAIRAAIDREVGGGIVSMGLSGGVDSTVVAAIASPLLRNRLHGFTIDANHLRLNELDEVALHAKAAGMINHRVVDLHDRVALFAGITDAETKRKQVFQKGIYIPGTVGEVNRVGATHFLQGTLAPDLIESGATGGDSIKTHHNVGIDVGVPQLHPLSSLFKYEVRALARALGLPESVSERKPSPGPGLFLDIIGVPVCDELLDCVRISRWHVERILQSDQRFWREEVSQPVVAYLGTPTTGQKGEARVYGGSIAVRVVKTLDFMTAEGIEIPSAMRRQIKSIVPKHPLVVRVFFDETDKPPATTVYE